MEFRSLLPFAIIGIGLAGCAPAPAPQPIMPEPIYDKFGYAEVGGPVCIPSGQTQTPGTTYNPNLPTCESRCPPGTQLDGRQSSATHANSVRPLCVPIPRDSSTDRQPNPQRPNTNPTRG